jgi:hypothetical protein
MQDSIGNRAVFKMPDGARDDRRAGPNYRGTYGI